MIKAVLFDYGGVLTPGGTAGCVPRIFAAIYGCDAGEIADHDLLFQSSMGDISQADFFAEMNRRHPDGPRATYAAYMAATDIFEKSEPVYALAARLREQGIATGILSNINDFVADELRARGFYDGFSPVVLSCEEHLAKPQPRFYEIALERLGLPGDQVLLVDDQEKCRPPAEQLGMGFVLATSPQQIVDDVMALVAAKK